MIEKLISLFKRDSASLSMDDIYDKRGRWIYTNSPHTRFFFANVPVQIMFIDETVVDAFWSGAEYVYRIFPKGFKHPESCELYDPDIDKPMKCFKILTRSPEPSSYCESHGYKWNDDILASPRKGELNER